MNVYRICYLAKNGEHITKVVTATSLMNAITAIKAADGQYKQTIHVDPIAQSVVSGS